jgi:MYXO-CTERM domain-containing protein
MKMKNTFKYLPLVLGGMGLFATSANGAVSLDNGGLVAAFYQVTNGTTVGANTLIYDLGAASLYRENSTGASVSTINTGLASANLGTELTNAFGSNWADAGTVRWMIFGTYNSVGNTLSGDPHRTIYMSNLADGISNSTLRGQVTNDIFTFMSNNQGETATAGNADAAQILSSDTFSVSKFIAPTVATYFKQGTDLTQTLGDGTAGSGSAGSTLNVYRVIHTTTNADLTSGFGSGNATVGTGQLIGTFALSSSGNLSVIPEPSAALLGLVGAMGLVLRRRRNA